MANRPRNGRLAPSKRAARARRLREQGLTHRQIAERLDVSLSTIANDLRITSAARRADGADQSRPTEGRATGTPDGMLGSALGALLSPARALLDAAHRLVR